MKGVTRLCQRTLRTYGLLPHRIPLGTCACAIDWVLRPRFVRLYSATIREGPKTSLSERFAVQKSYPKRTHNCGELRASDVGERVVLYGWAQPLRSMSSELSFLPIRDGHGTTQLVLHSADGKSLKLRSIMQTIGPESVVCAVGTVNKRPDRMINPALPTGEVEIVLEDLICLNKALNVPFLPGQKELPNEEVRMRYRYVDLRRPTVQGNLRTRSKAAKTIRDYLFSQNFVEVETPMLFKSTPEGAREFLVPTRSHNRFYALPQSPQQHKQLLMAGGIDRYFQFARCFRDEDLRADRQPEFTQVDLEMSFVQPNDVQKVIEAILKSVWKEVLAIELPANAFKRITYNDAMRRYGSDKPDTRYGMEIIDISAFVPDAAKDDVIECLVIRDGAKMTASEIKEILQSAAIQDLKSIPHVKINESNIDSWLKKQTFTHFSSHCEVAGREIARQKEVKIGDAIFLHKRPAFLSGGNTPLGRIRVAAASKMATKGLLSIDPSQYNFMWVDSFPLFSPDEEGKRTLTSTHHPFTAPEPDDIDLLISNPEKVRGQHYDIVLNGIEVGGGSIRIHSAELQTFILERVLRLQKEEYNRFSHLVDALASGCPPHGGIALGFDRLMSIICQTPSIRDVIAFPKAAGGRDYLVESPSEVSDARLQEYGIRLAVKE